MSRTLKEIAQLVAGDITGDAAAVITGVAGIEEAHEGDITFLANPKYLPFLSRTRATAVIIGRDVAAEGPKSLIRVDNPSMAFTRIVAFLLPQKVSHPSGIHPSAVVSKSAVLGKSVGIGACAVIEDGARIGDNTAIYPNCSIGRDTVIGSNTIVYSNRRSARTSYRQQLRHSLRRGDRSDGFGFVTVNGVHQKIPQVGTVVIEDDVEIGANCTIAPRPVR